MTSEDDRLPVDEALGCQIESVHFIAAERRGLLNVPSGQSADMGAAVALFERIGGGVEVVECWSGGKPDVIYRRFAGRWTCVELSTF